MTQEEIIKQAVNFIQENKIVLSASTDFNVVAFWFETNESKIDDLLKKLSYNKSSFVTWWENLYKKYKSYKKLEQIFQVKPDRNRTLLWYGLNNITKDSAKTSSGFTDEKTWQNINQWLWVLCFALSIIELGEPLKNSEISEEDFEIIIGDDLKSSESSKPSSSPWGETASGMRSRNYRNEDDSEIWKEIPPTLQQVFTVPKSEEAVDSFTFLSSTFDRFIKETYYDISDENRIDIAGYSYPKVKNIALRNLIGLSEEAKFKKIKVDDQPADFKIFWQRIQRNYNKSKRIQEILNTKINICPPDEATEEKPVEDTKPSEDTIPLDSAKIIAVKQWLDNHSSGIPCIDQFITKTSYNKSFTLDQFKDWWKSTVANALTNFDLTTITNLMKEEIYKEGSILYYLYVLGIGEINKYDAFISTSYIPRVLFNKLNDKMKEFVSFYCDPISSESPTPALPAGSSTASSWSNKIKIAKVSDTQFKSSQTLDVSKLFKFSQTAPDECLVTYYSLGFQPNSKTVNVKEFFDLTQELFTLIRVNEFNQLIRQHNIGRNIAETINILDESTGLATGLASALLTPTERRK